MKPNHRAVSFGRDPSTYDRYRPDYPDDVIDQMLALAHPRAAVEVGAGTGLATRKVARDGLDLLCLEPAEGMAEVLRSLDLPGVTVEVATFEDWEGRPQSVDLLYAAQAWHWVDRAAGFAKARSVLRKAGVMALMWNIPEDRFASLRDVYRAHAPELLSDPDERVLRRDSHDWGEDMRAAGFREVSRRTHIWERELDAVGYRSLCSTYSDHILLEEDCRVRLLDAIEQAIAERGDTIRLQYRTELYAGRR